MISKILPKAATLAHRLFPKAKQGAKHLSGAAPIAMALLMLALPETAFAQSYTQGATFFCTVAEYIKYIAGAVCLFAISYWAINSIGNGNLPFGQFAIPVGVAAGLVMIAPWLVQRMGLAMPCSY